MESDTSNDKNKNNSFKKNKSTNENIDLKKRISELENELDLLTNSKHFFQYSNNKYFHLFNNTVIPIFLVNEETIIIDSNNYASDLFNLEKKFIISKPILNFIFSDYHDIFFYHIQKVFENGSNTSETILFKTLTGEPFYAKLNSSNIIDDINNKKLIQIHFKTNYIENEKLIPKDIEIFRSIYSNSPTNYILLNIDFQLIYFNKSSENYFKNTYDVDLSKNILFYTYFDSKKAETLKKNFHEALSGKIIDKEIIQKTLNQLKNIHVVFYPIYNEENKITHILYTENDITQKKSNEQAELLNLKSLLNTTLESTLDGILVTDTVGNITFYNKKFLRIWDYSEELIELHKYDIESRTKYFATKVNKPEKFISKMQNVYRIPEGSLLDLVEFKNNKAYERYSKPQIVDGKIIGRIWNFREITEIKQMEESLFSKYKRIQEQNEKIYAQNEELQGLIDQLNHTNQQLFESEEKFRQLADNTDDVFWIQSIDNDIIYINNAFEKIWNISISEMQSNPLAFLKNIHHDDVEKINNILNHPLPKKTEIEFRIVKNNNKICWIWSRWFPIFNDKNQYHRKACISSDITERKIMETNLVTAKLQQKAILDNLPLMAWLKNTEGKFIAVNKQFANICGYSIDEIIGKTDFDVWKPEIAEKFMKEDLEIIASGKQKYSEERMTITVADNWYETFRTPIFNESGDIVGTTGITRDITERKVLDDMLKINEERFRSLVQNSSDIILILDEKAKIKYQSVSVDNSSRYTFYEVYDKNLIDYVHPDDIEIISNAFIESHRNPDEIVKIEIRLLQKNKEWTYFEVIISNQLKNPSIKGIVVNSRDITDRKVAQEKEKQYLKDLTFLNSTAISFVQLSDKKEIYRFIAEKIFEIVQNSIVIVSSYNETESLLSVEVVVGANNFIDQVDNILGKNLLGLNLSINKKFKDKLSYGKLDIVENGLQNIFFSELDKNIIREFERQFDISNIYVLGLVRQGNLLGDVLIITRNNEEISNKDLIETFIRQASIALHRKQVEVALQESEELYQKLITASPDAISISDTNGVIIYISPKVIELFGLDSENDILGKNIIDFIDNSDKERAKIGIQSIYFNKPSKNPQYVLLRKDRTRFFGEINSAVVRELDGRPKYMISITRDITERKLNEVKLKQSEAQLRLAQKIAKFGSLEINILTKEITVSDSLKEIFNINETVIKNLIYDKNDNTILHPDDRELFFQTFDKIKNEKNDSFNLSFRIITANHVIKYINLVGKIQYNDKKEALKVIVTLQDVSEQKINEELRKSVEIAQHSAVMKQQFLANMSHEIRTPMTGIIGMIEVLLYTELTQQQIDYIYTIKNSSENLLNLINDILDLSKIEAGKMTLKPKVFNIHHSIKKVKGMYDALAIKKSLYIDTSYSNELPDYIKADEIRMIQVINNLVSNAIKFTEKGGVKINFLLLKKEQKNIVIKVEVIDSGIGISKDDQNKLFNMFTQIDSSLSKNYEGTGLGLAICKEMTKLMGGEVGIDSELGKGCKFWFTFNALAADASEVVEEEKEIINTQHFNLDLYILLVEDKQTNQQVVTLMLEKAGCKVDLAENGLQAIELITQNIVSYQSKSVSKLYDIVLMDIQMPVMDGITTVKKLRSMHTSLPPIIALSANALDGDAEKYISEGVDDYLPKPVKSALLYDKIAKWSNKKNVMSNNPIISKNIEIDEYQIVSSKIIEELKDQIGGNQKLLITLFESFISDCDELMNQLDIAIENNDNSGIKRAIHSIKGIAGTMGAEILHNISIEMDKLAKNEDIEKFKNNYSFLKENYKNLREYINTNYLL